MIIDPLLAKAHEARVVVAVRVKWRLCNPHSLHNIGHGIVGGYLKLTYSFSSINTVPQSNLKDKS
jgi:hypothetical protein